MSLADLQAEVESYRAEAGRIAEDFDREQAQVLNDPNLSVAGKREHLESRHRETTEQISELYAQEKGAVKSLKEMLERRLFGLSPSASNDPARVVSFRDAQARARELEDGDAAAELYQSALRSGDNILATAVLEKALVRGWSSIKADFLERNTAARGDLDDLAALAQYGNNGLANVIHYAPPTLNAPFPSGMPEVLELNRSRKPSGVRPLRPGFGTR